jgi:hypothetical protein
MLVNFFESIRIKPPIDNIYKRLGYKKGVTKLPPETKSEIEQSIGEASSLIDLKGAAALIKIERNENPEVVFLKGNVIRSSLLSNLLRDCGDFVFMGVTGGAGIVQEIDSRQKSDLTKSVIFDAVASETVDAAFDWIQDYLRQNLRRQGKQLTSKRISCGYGDFGLENQKKIINILQMNKFGVTVSDSYMLIPEKSATAVAGVGDIGQWNK